MKQRVWGIGVVGLVAIVLMASAGIAEAGTIGRVKNVAGAVEIVRGAETLKATAGQAVEEKDVVRTGADGSVGILFDDDTMMSAGPNSEISLERYRPDDDSSGAFETDVRKGTLSVISGKIAKKSPNSMRVTTPRSILGVRGTYFLVKVDG